MSVYPGDWLHVKNMTKVTLYQVGRQNFTQLFNDECLIMHGKSDQWHL